MYMAMNRRNFLSAVASVCAMLPSVSKSAANLSISGKVKLTRQFSFKEKSDNNSFHNFEKFIFECFDRKSCNQLHQSMIDSGEITHFSRSLKKDLITIELEFSSGEAYQKYSNAITKTIKNQTLLGQGPFKISSKVTSA